MNSMANKKTTHSIRVHLHYRIPEHTEMICPRCHAELAIGDRGGVEIDYCKGCRGIWLDAGELDKIIDRSGRFSDRRDDDHDRERGRDFDDTWWGRIIDIFD